MYPPNDSDRFFRYYEFDDYPEFTLPIIGKTVPLISESYRIAFDKNGRAIALRRRLFVKGTDRTHGYRNGLQWFVAGIEMNEANL
jgi:hypothetical protein